MDISNLVLGAQAPHKTKLSESGGRALSVTDKGQNAQAAVNESANLAATEAAPAKQVSEAAVDDSARNPSLIQDTLRKLNDLSQTSIVFSQHEETGRSVITVSDKETGEEIRTIPNEDLLAIAAHLEASLDSAEGLKPGMLVSSQA